jgi:hypothetical protein
VEFWERYVVNQCADIFSYTHIFLLRAEAVRHTPHTWLVIKYYAMVDLCILSIINR